MEGKYTFKEFYENLENGYQIYTILMYVTDT